MTLSILFSLWLGGFAGATPMHSAQCQSGLTALDRVRELRPHEGELAGYIDEIRVFVKTLAPKNTFSRKLADLDVIASAMDRRDVGPRYFGMSYYPGIGRYVQIFDFIEGELIYADEKTLPEGINVTERTVADIDHVFDVLNEQSILAFDLQFLITPDGRAFVIDYDEFEFGDRTEAEDVNERNRRPLLEMLRALIPLDHAA